MKRREDVEFAIWIRTFAATLAHSGLSPKAKADRAIAEWNRIHNMRLASVSERAQRIRAYFVSPKSHLSTTDKIAFPPKRKAVSAQPRAEWTVSMPDYVGRDAFTGAFLYMEKFWPIHILPENPRQLDLPLSSLSEMPEEVHLELRSDPQAIGLFTLTWADCRDFARGFNAGTRQAPSFQSRELLRRADRLLHQAIGCLLCSISVPEAAALSYDGFNTFVEAILLLAPNATSHGGEPATALRTVAKHFGDRFRRDLSKLSSLQAELDQEIWDPASSLRQLWKGYSAIQFAGATAARLLGNVDVRSSLVLAP